MPVGKPVCGRQRQRGHAEDFARVIQFIHLQRDIFRLQCPLIIKPVCRRGAVALTQQLTLIRQVAGYRQRQRIGAVNRALIVELCRFRTELVTLQRTRVIQTAS